jgi:hypothetical protein
MTQQVGHEPQTSELTRYCTSCGAGVEVAARFCGACGHPVDTTTALPAAEAVSGASATTHGHGSRRWWLAGGIGLATLLTGAGVAATVVLTQPHPEDAVLVESSAQTVPVLEQMAAAETTAELRETAEAAETTAAPVVEILPTLNPTDPTALALASLEEVLVAVSALEVIDGDSLGEWPAISRDLDAAIDSLPGDDPAVDDVEPAGRDAIEAVDALVADAEQTLADWEASVAVAEKTTADNAAVVQELDTYEDAVLGQLRTYNSLRNDTSDFVDLVESPQSYVTWEQGYQAMSSGAEARREVRDALNAIAIPDGIQAEHARLVAMVEDAAAAMDAGYSGLSEADACWFGECYYNETPGWRQFQQESARITGEFAAAETAWQSTLAGLRAPLSDVTAPEKPVV